MFYIVVASAYKLLDLLLE